MNDKQKELCKNIFQFLDKNNDEKISPQEIIYGLGILGKNLSNRETKKILKEYFDCDLDGFINICSEKVDFNMANKSMAESFNIIESKEKPGYISQRDFIFVLRQCNESITDKDINDIVSEIGEEGGYISLRKLANDMLVQ